MNAEDEEDKTVIRPRVTQRPGVPAPPDARAAEASPAYAATMVQTAPATPATALGPPPSAAPSQHAITLPEGTRLGEFEVRSTIGEGGFGIVYLAWDHSLDRKVALKEYMPSSIAFRAGQSEIRARSERHQETFDAGMKSFINEAKLLAQFDHPSLLKVYRFWEANGTAYMVMPFLEGRTVRDTVRAMPAPPDEAWILGLLRPVCDALAMLHAVQVYHRDIAPDNILLLAETGRPLLLDFGAARRVIGDMTQALTAILKPGYAPVEQYADMPGLKQGPWTDVYALAAVAHWMILGKTPSPSVGRLFDDAYVPLAQSAAGRYSTPFLQAIDRALAVMPDKRTQTVEAFRDDLLGTAPRGPVASASSPSSTSTSTPRPPPRPAAAPARAATVPAAEVPPRPALSPPVRTTRRRMPVAIAGALVAVAAAAFVLWPKAPKDVPEPPLAGGSVAPIAASSTAPSAVAPTPAVPSTVVPIEPAPPPAAAASQPPAVAENVAPTPAAPPVRTRPPKAEAPRSDVPRAEATRPAAPREAAAEGAGSNRDECAKLFQRLSIGDTDQSLIDRIRTLRCR